MKILNFGSLNIDYVYRVPYIVEPGETVASQSWQTFAGGKGANQSVALALAGAEVYHAGKVGEDGQWLLEKLKSFGVDTRYVWMDEEGPTGHAMIQVDRFGQNAIVLHAGSNNRIDRCEMDDTLSQFGEGDYLLLQNEINDVAYLIEAGHHRGMKICFNPAPYTAEVQNYPLKLVETLIVNESEGMALAGTDIEAALIYELGDVVPRAEILVTLGPEGVLYHCRGVDHSVPAPKVKAEDTTAAGDTFVGYYLASKAAGFAVPKCLRIACHAAAVCVAGPGAMDSIPRKEQVVDVIDAVEN